MVLQMVKPTVRTLAHRADYGKFEVEPLERGYGITIGNALRRILLSSIPGAAVTAVRIAGVLHEFAPLTGVREDVVQLLLNLKNLAIRVYWTGGAPPTEVRTLRLEAKGVGRVTAADIQCPADVEIANPELYLATISDPNGSLEADIFVEVGRGYLPADKMERYRGQIGIIQVNALFTPVQKVNYFVEATRVGERTDFDRLIMEVWTNGTISPSESIARAAQVLNEQVSLFTDFDRLAGDSVVGIERSVRQPVGATIVPDTRVEELNFSPRTFNRLKSANIGTLRELAQHSAQQLMAIKNFGKKALQEVQDKLAEFGINLVGASQLVAAEEEEE